MRNLLLLALVVVLPLAGKSQVSEALESKLKRSTPSCYDIGYNCLKAIPQFYEDGKMDSLKAVHEFLIAECKSNYYTDFLSILLAIDDGTFEVVDSTKLVSTLVDYKRRADEDYLLNALGTSYEPMARAIDDYFKFLKKYASELMKVEDYNVLYYDVTQFMAGDYNVMLTALESGNYQNLAIQAEYNDLIVMLNNEREIWFGLTAGVWMPTGNLMETIGAHASFGITGGFSQNKNYYDFSFMVRVGNSSKPYNYRDDDTVYTTSDFSGVHAGFGYGRSIYSSLNHNILVKAGIAYEEITIIHKDAESETDPVKTLSLNLNVGISYRFYLPSSNCVELDLRYHVLDFKNNVNNSFSGDAITLRCSFYFTYSNYPKREMLKALTIN